MKTTEILDITKTLKLLYVEDDSMSRASSLGLFELFFTNITIGIDGKDGLEKFKSDTFDIVISDINMPYLNGVDMFKLIRDFDEEVSLVLLSAHNEAEYLLKAIEVDVDSYMLKPLGKDNFTRSMTKVCEKIKLKRESQNYQLKLEKEIKEQTKELEHKLHFDESTGLYNHYSFVENIKNLDTPVVMIIDINKFKVINEIYGVANGTLVLQKFSSFLLQFIENKSYTLYRVSGDEFTLLDVTSIEGSQKYENDIISLHKSMEEFNVSLGDDSVSLEVTIGISVSQHHAFECAKVALDFAKLYKKPYEMYTSAIDKRKEEENTLLWKNKIKSAIYEDRVVPVYHGIVDRNQKIIKYETLMRLKEQDGKLISPAFFLDISIKAGLYHKLSSHVVFSALKLIKKSSYTVSVNFSYADIINKHFLDEIEEFLVENPEVGSSLIFEILESENIGDYATMKKFLQRFRMHNVQIAVDDFGSGFSNFEHILEINPDYLKIDGSLVKDIDTNPKSYILVSAIVEFSHKLGIKVIAEFVHSKAIFDMLKELDVDEYQGFYFHEPLEELPYV